MPHPHFVSPANAMVACPCRIVILDSFWHPADNERRVVAAVAVVVVRSFFHSQARKKRGGRTDGLLFGMGNIEGGVHLHMTSTHFLNLLTPSPSVHCPQM